MTSDSPTSESDSWHDRMADDSDNSTASGLTGVSGGGVPSAASGGVSDSGVSLAADALAGVTAVEIQEEMERSFLDYAMSVIISRALPDARDGLKPVHRRILWSMLDQGFRPDRGYVKCARVVGDVMARFHPHGDSAIYDALARMAQPFSLRHTLIDFHGNYGSPEHPPAASRYTECRLDALAMQMLADISEDTVDFTDNYSGDFTEPAVLPARLPNLLVNGSQGIAVGMATSIPPHNLAEVINAVICLIDDPDATIDDLMEYVAGPDFPTSARILGREGIKSAYRTGRGSVKMRSEVSVDEIGGRTSLVVSSLPYQVSAGSVARKISDLVNARELDGIADVNDESSGDDTRFVIKLKRDANPEVVLNNLWKHTPLQSSFPVNMVALVDGVPRTLTLKTAIAAYAEHQIEVVTRRSEFRLAQSRARLHILEGLIRALDVIDEIIAAIRASEDRPAAQAALEEAPFGFSEKQAVYILDMALARLTRMGRAALEAEAAEKREQIAELEAILSDDGRLRAVIREELTAVKRQFATPRRSPMEIDPGEFDIEDLIDDDNLVFTLSASGYAKTVPVEEFRRQGRGGRGVAATKLKDPDDAVAQMIHTTAHSYLLLFSNLGKVYRLKAHEVPKASRQARGTAIVNLLPLVEGERIQAIIDTRDYETNQYLFFATARGRVKRTRFTDYDSSRKAGLIAIKLVEGDELVSVMPTDGVHDVLLSSRRGRTIRFSQGQVRPTGRGTAGVIGLRFKHGDDALVSCTLARPEADLLCVTSAGFGKRTPISAFPVKGRSGLGVIAISLARGRGSVITTLVVDNDDEIMAVTRAGKAIRTPVADISVQGRHAAGVKVMRIEADDRVAAVALVGGGGESDYDCDVSADGEFGFGGGVSDGGGVNGGVSDGGGVNGGVSDGGGVEVA